MAYATLGDVGKILPEEVALPDPGSQGEDNLLAALEEATDTVIGYLGREYTGDPTDPGGVPPDLVPEDVPGAVRRVVARVAMRLFMDDPFNPGAESEVNLMGPFSHTVNWSLEAQSRSPHLTAGEKLRLDPYRSTPVGRAMHFPMAWAGDD